MWKIKWRVLTSSETVIMCFFDYIICGQWSIWWGQDGGPSSIHAGIQINGWNTTYEKSKAERWISLRTCKEKEKRRLGSTLKQKEQQQAFAKKRKFSSDKNARPGQGRGQNSLISFKGQTRNSAPDRFGLRPKNKFVKSIRDSARVAKISQSRLSDKFVPHGVHEN